jgi:hypothetical protein
MIGHSMGGKRRCFFATLYPEMVDKLYRRYRTQILSATPSIYFGGLNAVDFAKKPSRSEVEDTLSEYIQWMGLDSFLMKSLFCRSQDN